MRVPERFKVLVLLVLTSIELPLIALLGGATLAGGVCVFVCILAAWWVAFV